MNKFIGNLRCNGDCELVYLRPFYNLDKDNIHYVCDYDEDKIGVNVFALYEENVELKKQLEEKEDYTVIPNCDIKPLLDKYKKQQQEFIKYLENEIKACKAVSDLLFNSNKEMKVYKEILQKYKKIIGAENDTK